tara:strand:+ start:66 stop:215 length:150 start_codon:yes stop_codon:yes gene_type:complete
LIILKNPITANKKKEIVITDLIKNLKGSPPGSGLDSKILYESATKGIEV